MAGDKVMKKIFILISFIVFLTGCASDFNEKADPTEPVFEEIPNMAEGNKNPEVEGNLINILSDDLFYGYGDYDNKSGRFSQAGYISIYENWIYYSKAGELWKSSRDLINNLHIFPDDYFDLFYINPSGYILKESLMHDSKTVLFNVRNNSVTDIDSSIDIPTGKLYKDNIILIKDGIQLFDLKDEVLKTIFEGQVYSNAIIDNYIYFHSIPNNKDDLDFSNTIMRCNLDDGTTEIIFSFTAKKSIYGGENEYYEPQVFYNGRNIIVENDINSFVYTNIDSIEPLEVMFSGQGVWAIYIPSDDNDLYFEVVYDLDKSGTWKKSRSEYYKVKQGTNEPILLNAFGTNLEYYSLYFSEGFLYYYGDDFYNNNYCSDIK